MFNSVNLRAQSLSEEDKNISPASISNESLHKASQDDQRLNMKQQIQENVEEKSKFYKFHINYLEKIDSDKE